MRILAVIAGIALMGTGIWCLAHRGAMFLNIAFVLGCAMVFAGVICILVYFFAPGRQKGFGWFFVEGLTTLILGSLVLANKLPTDIMVPVFFGMWILFFGVMRTVASVHQALEKNSAWIFTLATGVLSLAFGIYTFYNHMMTTVIPLIILVSIVFLIQGVNILVYGVSLPGNEKIKKYKKSVNRQQQSKRGRQPVRPAHST